MCAAMRKEVAIVGAGYVGLPLAVAFAEVGTPALLIDVDRGKVESLRRGESYVEDVPSELLARLVGDDLIAADTRLAGLAEADAIVICLPTPLSRNREPDLSIVTAATRAIAPHVRPGHLVVLESTTFPGTTREVLRPLLEADGLRAGEDFHLAMSPERIDPGRTDHTIRTTPKVVGGLTPACTERALAL
jgi:UDP-N-acetyl-D-glucosamine dehydrogenase